MTSMHAPYQTGGHRSTLFKLGGCIEGLHM